MTHYMHRGDPSERDDLLRALGRYVVSFSGLEHMVESTVIGTIQWSTRPEIVNTFNTLAKLAAKDKVQVGSGPDGSRIYEHLTPIMARKLPRHCVEIFFGLCRAYGTADWDDEDRGVFGTVEKEMLDATERRNRLLHDSWSVLGENAVQVSDRPRASHNATRTRMIAGGTYDVEIVTADHLEAGSERLKALMLRAHILLFYYWEVDAVAAIPHFSLDPERLPTLRGS